MTGANIVGNFIVCHKMSPSLSGCTVLVTGASAGIGAATAVHFAKFGLNNDLSDFHADDEIDESKLTHLIDRLRCARELDEVGC